jgi:hypothetical protein
MTDSSSPDGNPKWPWRYVAHATIEFRTPFAIRSGRGDVFSDSLFVGRCERVARHSRFIDCRRSAA